MSKNLVIRSVPLDAAVYSVFRMADRRLGAEFDVLDCGENAPVWRLVAQKLGCRVNLQPRHRSMPQIGPWDLPSLPGKYDNAYVLGTGPRGGLDQIAALARNVSNQPVYYDVTTQIEDSLTDPGDIELMDSECRRQAESERPSRIPDVDLRVIRVDRLGDLICTVPLLGLLKEFFPGRRLSLLVDKRFASLAKRISYVDHVEILDTMSYDGFHASFAELPAADWQIMPMNGTWRPDFAASVNRRLPANYKVSRVEFDDSSDLRYVHMSHPREVVEAASLAMMARYPGVFAYNKEANRMTDTVDSVRHYVRPRPMEELFLFEQPSEFVAGLALSQDDLLFAPLGGSSERDWTVKGWSETAAHALTLIAGRLILTGDESPRQQEFNARLAASVSSNRLIDLTGKTSLDDLLQIASACGGYLGANTAPMHLMALQGKKTVALNSPFESADLWRYPFACHTLVSGKRLLQTWRQLDLTSCVEKIWRRSAAPENEDYFYSVPEVTEAVSVAFGPAEARRKQAS